MTRRKRLTLAEYAARFLSERDVSPLYAMQIKLYARKLCEFAGKELTIAELDYPLVNDWLVYLKESGKAPHSVCTMRGMILAIWNAAYVDELNENPPLRVRKVKKPRLIIECYKHSEIQQLLDAAAATRGYDANGNKRSDFWQAMFHAAYSSGLRRGDLLAVRRDRVADDGLCTVIQHKTGYPITVRFSPQAMEWALRLKPVDGLLLPWAYRLDSFTFAFQRVRNRAGLSKGSFRWLRRSAGSYAEAEQNGAGSRILGHRDHGVFARHYEDTAITATKPVEPPPMAPPVGKEAV